MSVKKVKKRSAKKLDVLRRRHALTALERVKLIHVKKQIYGIAMIIKVSLRYGLKDRLTRSRKLLLQLFQQHHAIALVNDNDIWGKIKKAPRRHSH